MHTEAAAFFGRLMMWDLALTAELASHGRQIVVRGVGSPCSLCSRSSWSRWFYLLSRQRRPGQMHARGSQPFLHAKTQAGRQRLRRLRRRRNRPGRHQPQPMRCTERSALRAGRSWNRTGESTAASSGTRRWLNIWRWPRTFAIRQCRSSSSKPAKPGGTWPSSIAAAERFLRTTMTSRFGPSSGPTMGKGTFNAPQ
jgi:hypothetical protein